MGISEPNIHYNVELFAYKYEKYKIQVQEVVVVGSRTSSRPTAVCTHRQDDLK